MGSCFSSASSNSTPTVKIVALDGSLNELSVPVPVPVSFVLPSPQSSVLCDSDSLNFGTNIVAMNPKSMLELDHLYFVLPAEKLGYPLSGQDMVAVKASTALARASEKSGRRRRMKILPIEEMGGDGDVDGVERIFDEFRVSKVGKEGGNRSLMPGVIRNRMKLTTIDE
ncbi:uncharacterized protein A4U43_UnF11100 [Asparagus officinalis]|uniref:Uncharacterized protein n=1 Tax=Asparagus officinalis TaxID=4686 RepID=A0A1R3L5B8_ASPOF|nr:uncharacterized protein LOC109828199 [Asparagus officinalis]ONK54809.1 uncharacterized protein A4U43_UnF11100 [Asparagus officinalis]